MMGTASSLLGRGFERCLLLIDASTLSTPKSTTAKGYPPQRLLIKESSSSRQCGLGSDLGAWPRPRPGSACLYGVSQFL